MKLLVQQSITRRRRSPHGEQARGSLDDACGFSDTAIADGSPAQLRPLRDPSLETLVAEDAFGRNAPVARATCWPGTTRG